MPPQQRIEFVAAVECLQTQQSAYLDVDAAKSAFDDFIVLHYHLTPFVHMSVRCLKSRRMLRWDTNLMKATFFTFHRYYLWTYEHKLRTLCKYKGSLRIEFRQFTNTIHGALSDKYQGRYRTGNGVLTPRIHEKAPCLTDHQRQWAATVSSYSMKVSSSWTLNFRPARAADAWRKAHSPT